MLDRLTLLLAFASARWSGYRFSRTKLAAHQSRRLKAFFGNLLLHFPNIEIEDRQRLEDFPIIEKAFFLEKFATYNRHGLSLQEAQDFAQNSENSRQFSRHFHGLTVGLSSGTSGRRGVFLASRHEQSRWAGILLARMLRPRQAWQILNFLKPPLQIAFFLRSDSRLYQTLSSKRIQFCYYDLMTSFADQIERLNTQQPHILTAPASVLVELARRKQAGQLRIAPEQVISVAETLEPDDRNFLTQVFGTKIEQIYQATEGFLAYTCGHGRLHLNEAFIHFEKEWLDAEKKRFVPIITDFTRETQAIVRYRLDDILQASDEKCPCGSRELVLDHIEGRLDDVLKFNNNNGKLVNIFPDAVRKLFFVAQGGISNYRLEQTESELRLSLEADDLKLAEQSLRTELDAMWAQNNIAPPLLVLFPFPARQRSSKNRRIICNLPCPKPHHPRLKD